MKKKVLLVMIIFLLFTLTSCQSEDEISNIVREGREVAETSDDEFRIVLYSEKDQYLDTEEVDIWATLEYIGEEDEVEIYSGIPYAGFIVECDGVTFITNLSYKMLISSTLEKGEIYTFPLVKVGGYSEDAEDADFWREFYEEEEMFFPIGEYQLTFSTDFNTEDSSDFELSIQYQFEVN